MGESLVQMQEFHESLHMMQHESLHMMQHAAHIRVCASCTHLACSHGCVMCLIHVCDMTHSAAIHSCVPDMCARHVCVRHVCVRHVCQTCVT